MKPETRFLPLPQARRQKTRRKAKRPRIVASEIITRDEGAVIRLHDRKEEITLPAETANRHLDANPLDGKPSHKRIYRHDDGVVCSAGEPKLSIQVIVAPRILNRYLPRACKRRGIHFEPLSPVGEVYALAKRNSGNRDKREHIPPEGQKASAWFAVSGERVAELLDCSWVIGYSVTYMDGPPQGACTLDRAKRPKGTRKPSKRAPPNTLASLKEAIADREFRKANNGKPIAEACSPDDWSNFLADCLTGILRWKVTQVGGEPIQGCPFDFGKPFATNGQVDGLRKPAHCGAIALALSAFPKWVKPKAKGK